MIKTLERMLIDSNNFVEFLAGFYGFLVIGVLILATAPISVPFIVWRTHGKRKVQTPK